VPSLAPEATPAAIRDSLVKEERVEFEQAYRSALAEAAETLDLTGVLDVLRAYHRIAVQTRQHGAQVHRRMLAKARRITAARHNPDAVELSDHRDRIERAIGR
jgi:hypothetical protein